LLELEEQAIYNVIKTRQGHMNINVKKRIKIYIQVS